ncbi:TetR/AcrR family transcriptional regulator [Oceanobacter mangrovi]|uniref:TetR/AcrR family transcriptional regulator n=1 Tax=Oceanobacter mangrovi TaxID=2862510 RepID=UPI001C8D7BDC|nr:TetR/AcrR family transcriptional regulator [Oceanobacter mangrovi]
MPKIVDHDKYRAELAQRAVPVFRREGFNGMSMRRMAEALGVSKGVLYHYFPSKQALFEACSGFATEVPRFSLETDASTAEKLQALTVIAAAMEDSFAGELTLLLDYTRNRNADELAQDPEMNSALARYTEAIAGVVGEENALKTLTHLLGILLIRLLGGRQLPLSHIAEVL